MSENENTQMSVCGICGAVHREEDLSQVDGRIVCDECYSRLCHTCSICGEVHIINTRELRVGYDDYEYICNSCIEDDAIYYCENCQSYVHTDDYYCGECQWCHDDECHDDECYDDECYDDCDDDDCGDRFVKPYHYHKGNEQFFGTDSNVYIGIELEVDEGTDPETVCSLISDIAEDRLYFEHDGSLSGRGIEIISQPHTLKKFDKIPWEKAMSICKKYDYTSHDNGRCGLHIHLSREMFGADEKSQKNNLTKLVYFYEKHFDDLFRASRMTWSQVNDYCGKYAYDHIRDVRKTLNDTNNHYWNRYLAVNLTNPSTVEFRLGRGTLVYSSFRAWIDLTVTMARNICALSWDELLPANVLEGIMPETAEYLKSRRAFAEVL